MARLENIVVLYCSVIFVKLLNRFLLLLWYNRIHWTKSGRISCWEHWKFRSINEMRFLVSFKTIHKKFLKYIKLILRKWEYFFFFVFVLSFFHLFYGTDLFLPDYVSVEFGTYESFHLLGGLPIEFDDSDFLCYLSNLFITHCSTWSFQSVLRLSTLFSIVNYS